MIRQLSSDLHQIRPSYPCYWSTNGKYPYTQNIPDFVFLVTGDTWRGVSSARVRCQLRWCQVLYTVQWSPGQGKVTTLCLFVLINYLHVRVVTIVSKVRKTGWKIWAGLVFQFSVWAESGYPSLGNKDKQQTLQTGWKIVMFTQNIVKTVRLCPRVKIVWIIFEDCVITDKLAVICQ